jgi:hypothetical protein
MFYTCSVIIVQKDYTSYYFIVKDYNEKKRKKKLFTEEHEGKVYKIVRSTTRHHDTPIHQRLKEMP